MDQAPYSRPHIQLPNAPVLIADYRGATMLTTDGELVTLDKDQAILKIKASPPILCHAKATARYLKTHDFPAFDLLELFAFVRPAQFAVPTPLGLANVFSLPRPDTSEDAVEILLTITHSLLSELLTIETDVYALAWRMTQAGWSWGPFIINVLDELKLLPSVLAFSKFQL